MDMRTKIGKQADKFGGAYYAAKLRDYQIKELREAIQIALDNEMYDRAIEILSKYNPNKFDIVTMGDVDCFMKHDATASRWLGGRQNQAMNDIMKGSNITYKNSFIKLSCFLYLN